MGPGDWGAGYRQYGLVHYPFTLFQVLKYFTYSQSLWGRYYGLPFSSEPAGDSETKWGLNPEIIWLTINCAQNYVLFLKVWTIWV